MRSCTWSNLLRYPAPQLQAAPRHPMCGPSSSVPPRGCSKLALTVLLHVSSELQCRSLSDDVGLHSLLKLREVKQVLGDGIEGDCRRLGRWLMCKTLSSMDAARH